MLDMGTQWLYAQQMEAGYDNITYPYLCKAYVRNNYPSSINAQKRMAANKYIDKLNDHAQA